MKRALAWISTPALFATLFFAGCGGQNRPTFSWAGWEQQPMQYAHYFQLWKKGNQHVLITFGPGGTADTTGLFVLGDDHSAVACPPGALHLRSTFRRVALLSTTHASFISALGQATDVVGCAHTDRLRDTAVAALARSGRVMEIGSADGVDKEKLLALAPDALFIYPYGTKEKALMLGSIPLIPVAEYIEEHPLGRAEWVRAFGLLLGKEAEADSLFGEIAGRYRTALARVPSDGQAPVVFFGSAWKGAWSVPAGNSYMARLIGDAGGKYLFADRKADGNMDLSLETVLEQGAAARYWGRILDRAAPVTPLDVAAGDARIAALPAFKQQGCFYASSAESDLFGQAGLEPDVLLRDLIGIFRPALASGRVPVYFKPLQ
jgi:iron complex transport system substrate-binding protein